MIIRIWRGWTSGTNAAPYEELLRTMIFPGIRARTGERLRRIELMRRDVGGEVEFVTLLAFASRDDLIAFAGADYDVAVVPPAARALLARFDDRAAHYEQVEASG